MKDVFIGIITAAAGLTWVGFFIWFTNGTSPHPGSWQFLLGSGLTFVVGFGLISSNEKGKNNG